MSGCKIIFQEYWGQRNQISKGIWLLLFAYSLVAFGSPMPAKVTWLEIIMGGGLLLGGLAVTETVIIQARQNCTARWSLILLVFLFILPLYVGWARGNAISDIMRDTIPVAFLLLLPMLLIYSASPANSSVLRTSIVAALVFVGLFTTIVFYIGLLNHFGSIDFMVSEMRKAVVRLEVSQVPQPAHPSQTLSQTDALTNEKVRALFLKPFDPAMLFTAIFLSAWGIVLVVRAFRNYVTGIFLIGIGSLISYGFMVLGLRAYSALYALAICVVCLFQLRNRGFYIRLLPTIAFFCVVFWGQIDAVFHLLLVKQHVLGANGKIAEWSAVTTIILNTYQSIMLGIGWGGSFLNPIYGAETRFTHSILSFYLLKSGVIGLGMLLIIIGLLAFHIREIGKANRFDIALLIIMVSSIPPLLIGVLFEPTYKMLSYGLVLALFLLSLPEFKKPFFNINNQYSRLRVTI